MKTFADIIDRLGGYAVVAEEMPRPLTTVQSWRARNSIPPAEWLAIVQLASRLQVPGITLDGLARIAESRPRKRAA